MITELHNMDCIQGMRQLDSLSVDTVVTSPPYNIGIDYHSYDDSDTREDYLLWCRVWLRELHRVLRMEGSLFLNVGSSPSDPMLPHQLLILACQLGFKLQNTFHWIKSIAIADRTYGHFKPINSKRFVTDCHEYIFHLTCNGAITLDRLAIGVPYMDKTNITRRNHTQDLRCRGNTWFVPYKTRQVKLEHPASFPLELPEMCIKLQGGSVVLDPFMGVGNTLLAARRCSVRKFIGYEIDKKYFQLCSHLTNT